MLGIFEKDTNRRLGTVAKFVGNKPAERWVAWSALVKGEDGDGLRAMFQTRREAISWLVACRANERDD